MLIAELLENLPNDIDRILYLNSLKKQIEELEKPVKDRLLNSKLKHSRIKYVERKDWKPSKEVADLISVLDLEKKAIIDKSKADKQGSYKITHYLSISEPEIKKAKAAPTVKGETENFNSFFGV